MPNRLAHASSPYLLQHADNPVDWYEWGDEAFAAAAERGVPVLLSVGYAACHWCHVMAHESFEDPETAEVMNELFVNVKVDREERPDIDRIYMDATQAMTGRGGWPMTVFLTPEGKPFYAGTYFPKIARHGMPSFRELLVAIADAWRDRRGDVEAQAEQLTTAVRAAIPPSDAPVTAESLAAAEDRVVAAHDTEHGGFGGAPKFPQAPTLEFLLRRRTEPALQVVKTTLNKMADGGIYDHLGGGFARYAVDRIWLVPHFEKMLYDNALLARLYLRAGQALGEDRFLAVATHTLDYMQRDLLLPTGGLASSEDADSEGEEGTFYVWDLDEVLEIAGPIAADRFGVSAEGNFEGRNVLSISRSIDELAERHGADRDEIERELDRATAELFAARSERVRPGRDDKAIAAWNGLALRAFAEASVILERTDYAATAEGIATFLTGDIVRPDGRLLRSVREGRGDIPGFADDYGAVIAGLLAMNVADGDVTWLEHAIGLTEDLVRLFAAPQGGFYGVGEDADELIARPLDVMDNPVPSGNSLAAEALWDLGKLTGRREFEDHATAAVGAGRTLMDRHPMAVGHLLAVSDTMARDQLEVAIAGDPTETGPLRAAALSGYWPNVAIAAAGGASPPTALFDGRLPTEQPLAYVCRNFACEAPTADPVHLATTLSSYHAATDEYHLS